MTDQPRVSETTPERRVEPVERAGHVIGYTARFNLAEVEAVLIEPARPWDRFLGVFRRRSQGRRAIMEAANG